VMAMDEVEKLIEDLRDALRVKRLMGNGAKLARIEADLILMGEPGVKALIEALKGDDTELADHAARLLGGISEPAVEPLLGLLADAKDSDVRKRAMNVLIDVGMPAVKPLVEASRKPGYKHVRREISKILVAINAGVMRHANSFGCVEKAVLRKLKVPDEFKKAMLDAAPKKLKL